MKYDVNDNQNSVLAEILEKVNVLSLKLAIIQNTSPEHTFFDNQQFIQIMNISKRTAQEWRNQNLIAYSQVGKKFYYRLGDILVMLKKHHTPANLK